ncbi:alanine aminotransferase 1-like isoform X2 [Paramacrobiotus metropolitanus]|nr:alanine aminotransferase 1-like isoform X2 [Paramacrobiotus metropolitanus]XP_055327350.1 alanine aminotransferase 1-like isoform X2 [Paramacrobiotus metropolitanus]
MPTTVAADNGRAEQETVKKGNVKTSPKMGKKTLTLDTMNPHIKVMEYAVRGPIVIRAGELEMELKKGAKKPYKEIIRANIGDCHATGQVPITYIRNVLTLCINPKLLDSPDFAPDVKEHAKRILSSTRGGLGSYTDSTGLDVVRQDVADFIKRRDGIAADPDNIILTAGASEGIKALLKLINNEKNGQKPGVMVPIPQYPLYSATIAEYGMEQIGYYLDEDNNWALDINELKRSIREARKVCHPSVIVIINPGNPTGQVLTEENIRGIIKFAHEEGLYIMADEVYQDNVYAPGSKFHSFKKVMTQMGAPYDGLELASFYSTSKGFMGECGIRGAYMELVNMDSQVMAMLKKMLSAKLCPTSVGQACIGCVVSPPKQGDPSYESFMSEKQAVLKSLAEKAKLVTDTFNSIPGIHCNTVQGAMYAFPRLDLPQGLIDKAKSVGQDPDFYYALQLLENTGICIVPGSGFGQKPGTHHFRTTILPPPKQMEEMMVRFKKFHTELMEDKLKNV